MDFPSWNIRFAFRKSVIEMVLRPFPVECTHGHVLAVVNDNVIAAIALRVIKRFMHAGNIPRDLLTEQVGILPFRIQNVPLPSEDEPLLNALET